LDPGLGFYYRNLQDSAVRVRHQMNIFLNTFRLRELGFPICHALPHAFEFFRDEVRCAEPFFAVLAALGKTDLFRTHEVPRIKAVLDTMKADLFYAGFNPQIYFLWQKKTPSFLDVISSDPFAEDLFKLQGRVPPIQLRTSAACNDTRRKAGWIRRDGN
jgi:hypothetical protein